MYLEFRHLKTIKAIHDAGGLARAADQLNITQSALSHQVKGLEAQVGVELFVRRSKPMRLSPAGQKLLRLAERGCDDADWAARVALHRDRRPSSWSTLETTDAAAALTAATGPVLLDCLGTWLTAQLDDVGAWQAPESQWGPQLDERIAALDSAWRAAPHVVAVTNEVGWGVVPEHRSGRIFADRLGLLGQRLAAGADRVLLVVAGLVLTVKDADGSVDGGA